MRYLALLFVLLATPAWSATYYVKTGGNDAADGLSDGNAWETVTKVEATVTNGDIVYFREGDTWSGAVSDSDSVLNATAGVTYYGLGYGVTGTRAKIYASSSVQSDYGVVSINASNVTFDSFEVDGSGGTGHVGGIYAGYLAAGGASNITINNCVVHDIEGTAGNWNYGILVSSKVGSATVSNVTVTNNTVYNTFHEGIAIYPSWTTTSNKVDTITIRGNEVYNTGTIGGETGMGIIIVNDVKDATVEFNYLHDNDYGIWYRVSIDDPTKIEYPARNLTIRYNIIEGNLIGYTGWNVNATTSSDTTQHIYGNLFINNTDCDFMLSEAADWQSSTIDLYNNTFFNTVNNGSNTDSSVVFGPFSGGSGRFDSITINLKNNVIYTAGSYPLKFSYGAMTNGNSTHTNNLYFDSSGEAAAHINDTDVGTYNRAAVTTWEATAQNTDPTFAGGTLPTGFTGTYGVNLVPNTEYLTTASGPTIDTGATLGAPYNSSIAQAGLASPATRPQGAGYDLGAYEYTTAEASQTIYSAVGATISGGTLQ